MSSPVSAPSVSPGPGADGDLHPYTDTYQTGETIFKEGDCGGCAYLIERGHVEISQSTGGKTIVVAILGAGELIGEMASVDNQKRSATATALNETEVIPIAREQLDKVLTDADPLVNLLLRVVINRLRATQRNLVHDTQLTELGGAGPILPTDTVYESARNRAIGQIKLERALRAGLEKEEFELYYQPVVSSRGEYTAGFEALLRWHRPGMGLISPGEFIGLAEETGLIVPIALWGLKQACTALAKLQTRSLRSGVTRPPLFMSFNVSAGQLEDLDEVDRMIGVIERADIDPACIKLEITERLIMENPEAAARGLAKLKKIGVTLAIDDFGTGYSSLSYLHRFPLDTLKVDRSFVNTMLLDDGSLRIVRSITGLARELNMDIVAEGVETADQYVRVQQLGCDFAQGYLFARPLPIDDAIEILDGPIRWE